MRIGYLRSSSTGDTETYAQSFDVRGQRTPNGVAGLAEVIAPDERGLAPSIIVNLLGLPAVMVPSGLGDGLPAGVQLVACRYREDLCLAAGAAIESVVGTLVEQLWSRQ